MSRFNFKPIGDWVLVRKCLACPMQIDDAGNKIYLSDGVAVPDNFGERTPFAQIIDVGNDCELIKKEHCNKYAVMCPEYGSDLRRVQGEDFVVREGKLRAMALFELG